MAQRFPTPGLRQRKKERLRDELRRAATTLFLERGVEATTVDDIVARVDVSRRTFFRYFDGKEDAWFASPETDREWLERGIGEYTGDPVTVARNAYRTLVLEHFSDAERGLAMAQLVLRSPSLHAKYLLFRERNALTIARALATRLGQPPEHLGAYAIAFATVAVMTAAVYRWIHENGARPLSDVIDEACAVDEGDSRTPDSRV